jgi:hypothetical protein
MAGEEWLVSRSVNGDKRLDLQASNQMDFIYTGWEIAAVHADTIIDQ